MHVGGYVRAVPIARRGACRRLAGDAAAAFGAHAALNVVGRRGDDVPQVKLTSFPPAVQAGADETMFAWIGKRMIFGGCAAVVEA